MHKTAEKFSEQVQTEYGISLDIQEFPEGTKTAKDAADAIGCELGQIVKSVVMEVNGETVVVLTSGDREVSESKLSDYLDADEVSTASPDGVKQETGWSIGGVPPFCHEKDLKVLMDRELENYETVWAAAGTHEAVFGLEPERIRDMSDAELAEVFK